MTKTLKKTIITRFTVKEPGQIGFYKYAVPQPEDGQFLVETLYTGISAGTDLSHFIGTNPKHSSVWDPKTRLFKSSATGTASEQYPLQFFGDMQVGRVTASEVPGVKPGMIIAMDYGHSTGHLVNADDLYVPLPDNIDPILGIYVAKNGPVAANGLLYAASEFQRGPVGSLKNSLAGQRIVVMGAGVIGLLTAMLARWAGARQVAVVDLAADRLVIAHNLGFTTINSSQSDPAEFLKAHWWAADPLDNGADIAFQCTGSDAVLNMSLRCLREQGAVIDLGFYQGGASSVLFGNEFHHNRLRHICAQIGAVPREQASAWNRYRLATEFISFLQEHGPELRQHLITHELPFSQAQSVYEALRDRQSGMLQVVLTPDGKAESLASDDPFQTNHQSQSY